MSRYASLWNKRDAVERELIAMCTSLGVTWHESGPLDGWIHTRSQGWVPVEVKSPKGVLTKGQKAFVALCEHYNKPFAIWRTPSDVLATVQGKP